MQFQCCVMVEQPNPERMQKEYSQTHPHSLNFRKRVLKTSISFRACFCNMKNNSTYHHLRRTEKHNRNIELGTNKKRRKQRTTIRTRGVAYPASLPALAPSAQDQSRPPPPRPPRRLRRRPSELPPPFDWRGSSSRAGPKSLSRSSRRGGCARSSSRGARS